MSNLSYQKELNEAKLAKEYNFTLGSTQHQTMIKFLQKSLPASNIKEYCQDKQILALFEEVKNVSRVKQSPCFCIRNNNMEKSV